MSGAAPRRARLAGQVALVTGAARRIGRATALALAEQGVHVVVHYRHSEAEAHELVGELTRRGVKSWALQADFARPEQCEPLIDRAIEAAGTLDLLVNNASSFPSSTLTELSPQQLAEAIQVNAWAPLALSRRFVARQGRGTIVNLLDARIAARDRTRVGYDASKQLLVMFTRMSALQFAPHFRVNAVAPGPILPPPGGDVRVLEQRVRDVPLLRHGDPEDIADAVVFLAGSPFVTGHVLYVDGGWHLTGEAHGSHPD